MTNTSDDTLHSTAGTLDAFPLSATNTPYRCYFMADANLHSGDDTPDATFFQVLILSMLLLPSGIDTTGVLFVLPLYMLFSTVHSTIL